MEEIKRELVKKHLEDWNGLKKSSIEHFVKSGKASGSFWMALKNMLDEYAEQLRIPGVRGRFSRDEAEEFLQSKDIWNHPYISDRTNNNGYEVADLMAEFANSLNDR